MAGAHSLVTMIKNAKRIEWIALLMLLAALAMVVLGTITPGAETGGTELEQRVAAALASVVGAGRVRVLIGEGEEAGVLVVAEGAKDLRVALSLARAVQTLLGVDNHRIEVLKMDGGG